jgi:hypothetical protein
MDPLRSDDLKHRQALEILPWYVRRQLGPEESRQMDTHLAACPACRREAAGLTALFTAHEASIPDRPVDEKRLDALFDRIDQYEAARPRTRQKAAPESTWRALGQSFVGWLTAKPALAAGAFAAVLAIMIAIPTFDRPQPSTYEVLTNAGSAAALRVTLRLKAAQNPRQIEEMVAADRAHGKFSGDYRIEPRSATEYTIVFDQKPGVAVIGELIEEWRAAPNVAEVAIDSGPATR